MYTDCRRFIQLGAMTMLAEPGCCPKTKFIQGTPVPGDDEKPKLEPNLLGIDFQGLYLIEERPSAISVHLLDAPLLGMPAHLLQMRALKSTIDLSQTQEPDQYHRAPAGSDEWWMWDLKGMQVTTPASSSGQNDLTPIGQFE